MALVSAASMGSVVGCSEKELPMTQAEFTKAIVDHALASNCKIMVQSIVMVEKEKRRDDGSLPVKVRYACMDMPGKTAKSGLQPGHTVREETIQLHEATDSAGKKTWAVR